RSRDDRRLHDRRQPRSGLARGASPGRRATATHRARDRDHGDAQEVVAVMDAKRSQLEHEYKTALRDCLQGAGEAALAHAYELGRIAAGSGVGVVELATIHDRALREVLGDEAPPEQVDQFFTEALSPFEMTHRGFKEAN